MTDASRRDFLGQMTAAGIGGLGLASGLQTQAEGTPAVDDPSAESLTIGICADVHKDIIHDPDERLERFVAAAEARDVDIVVQMGDFCQPKPANRAFFEIFDRCAKPTYHVLGNHDIDGGYTWEQTLDYYGMSSRYDSFDHGPCHIVVLDGNERPDDHQGGYPRHIGEAQRDWLAEDLRGTDKPTLVLSHQSLENPSGVDNARAVREILEEANRQAGRRKVIACLSGHHHIDYATTINEIAYVQINSMSYFWVGGDYIRLRFDPAVDEANPWVRYTIPYDEPLWAFLTITPASGTLKIEGTASAFIPPGPDELGLPSKPSNNPVTPVISDRLIRF